MPRNTLMDLNNLLFEQLENLIEAEDSKEIDVQVKKAKAMKEVASVIVDNANTQLQAAKIQLEYGRGENVVPTALLGNTHD